MLSGRSSLCVLPSGSEKMLNITSLIHDNNFSFVDIHYATSRALNYVCAC
jgi:hypothetical protein